VRRCSLLRLNLQHACHAYLHHGLVLGAIDQGIVTALLLVRALEDQRQVEVVRRPMSSYSCMHHHLVADLQHGALEHRTRVELEILDI
jgi:hypothetical protein